MILGREHIDSNFIKELVNNEPCDNPTAILGDRARRTKKLTRFRSSVALEEKRRKKWGKQCFHFPRINILLDKNFERDKKILEEMEQEEARREEEFKELEAQSNASLFGIRFRLKEGTVLSVMLKLQRRNEENKVGPICIYS